MRFLVLTLLVPGLAQAGGPGGTDYYMHDYGWAGLIFGPLMMLLFLALIVGAVMVALRLFAPGGASAGRPKQILQERFARGEIDAEEFTARSRALDH